MRLNKSNSEYKKNASTGLRNFYIKAAGLLFFIAIIAVALFMIIVRSSEQVMVPDVQGFELTEALLELQEKELYPRIQMRYSQSTRDKGLILEQEPKAGTIVKAGRRIRLVVSQGVVLNRIENYIGRKIDDVQVELQTLAAASDFPLFAIKEPILYDFSSLAAGVIIRQKPEAETEIFGRTNLEFVVSRGQENAMVAVPQFTGLSLSAALKAIEKSGILFDFILQEANEGEKEETIVAQNPTAETNISVDMAVSLALTIPANLGENEVFNIFSHTMPKNPYPLPLKLEAELPSGEQRQLLVMDFPGGRLRVPYRLPVGSTIILTMMNREIYRETVQ
ncbi:MAG: PASTA domain-containing protein [Treponema sp.]|nr:PASTA domain-containing protein [Treponema sp.]